MFWTQNIGILLEPILIPTDFMSFDEKLNAITRMVIFICLICLLLLQDTRILLFMIIIVLIIIIIHVYYTENNIKIDKFLDKNNLAVIDNMICTKPSKHNPYMNPNLLDINNIAACSITNENIENSADNIYDDSMFHNVDDIYDRTTSKRQFYTIPSTTIPNEQNKFADWLYNNGPSCKEGNGFKCYTNLYKDIRV